MSEKIVTIFRTKQCKQGKSLTSAVRALGVDQEAVQVVYMGDSPEISTFFRVYESPTILLFNHTEEVIRYTGRDATVDKVKRFMDGK